MALFDKLKQVVDVAKDTVNKAIETAENIVSETTKPQEQELVPPLDENVKKYYEIIFWMNQNQDWSRKLETTDESSRARRYIELMLGEACDEEAFHKAVEYYNLGYIQSPKTGLETQLKLLYDGLKEEVRAVEEKWRAGSKEEAASLRRYPCDAEKAIRVCTKEMLESFQAAYDSILDVIKNNVNCNHFMEGFNKLIRNKYYGERNMNFLVYIVIRDSFYEGNPITKEILFKLYVEVLSNRFHNKKSSDYEVVVPFDIPNSLALHALHFEKYGTEQNGYTSVTDEEYREQIFNQPTYVRVLDDHPFEKEKYVQEFIKRFKYAYNFAPRFSSFTNELSWTEKMSPYFQDALANFLWKEVRKEYVGRINDKGENISESQNPVDIAHMLYDYIKKMKEVF